MDWMIAVAQQTQTSSSPTWLAPLLGGVGALVGGTAASTVNLFALADTKKARQRQAERDATTTLSAQLTKARLDAARGLPENAEWTPHFLELFGGPEAAVLTFKSKNLRDRLKSSLELIIWGADDSELQYKTRRPPPFLVYLACGDALECLGANLRDEKLPAASKTWKDATGQWEWQQEQIPGQEDGEA